MGHLSHLVGGDDVLQHVEVGCAVVPFLCVTTHHLSDWSYLPDSGVELRIKRQFMLCCEQVKLPQT